MKKILAIAVLALTMSLSASASCKVGSVLTHPALLTHSVQGGKLAYKGAKVVKRATFKAAKATASYGKKVLF